MRERIEEFKNEEVSVWVVAPSNAQFIGQFLDAFGPFPFPIIGDPERAAYREMGHKSIAKWKLYWLSAVGFFTSKMNNFIPKDAQQKRVVMKSIQTQDIFIQGGTYLYSKDGRLIWKHVDVSPEDHAKLDTVLKESKKS